MQKIVSYLLPIAILLISFSCSFKIDTGELHMDNWKEDRNGCKGLRLQDLEELRRIKNTFLATDNQSMIKTFGRPDHVELMDNHQTYFIYYLEPSKDCDGVKTEKEPLKILFRLNSLFRVSEVNITTLNP